MSFDYRNSRWALAGGLLMILGGALGSGCGGEDPIPGLPFPTQQSFCEKLAEVECSEQLVTACYGSDATSLSADTESCVKAARATSHCNPSGITYHPEKAEDCLAKHEQVYSDAQITAAELKELADACVEVFHANKGSGSGCNVDTDCDTSAGLRCVIKSGDSGQCFTPHFVSAGNKCTGDADICQTGFFCDGGGHCVSDPGPGEPCDADTPCGGSSFCKDMVCVAKFSNGSPCAADLECAGSGKGGFCITNSMGMDGHCAASLSFQITSSNCDEYR